MDRINAICEHPVYLSKMNTIRQWEKDRIYCRHDTQHLLDVARIMYITFLEKGNVFSWKEQSSAKELIYAAALLHDIGRADQYENGTPHDEAGAAAAEIILKDCGFGEEEINMISKAILGHRGTEDACVPETATFASLLKDADKKSRACFRCEARATCKWPDSKKNMEIEI